MMGGIFLSRDLVQKTSELTGLHPDTIMSRSNIPEAAHARFAIWRALRVHGLSYSQIGRRFGRHHTVIMHGCRRALVLMEKPDFAQLAHALERGNG